MVWAVSPALASSPSVSARLAGFAATLDVDALPEAVRLQARRAVVNRLRQMAVAREGGTNVPGEFAFVFDDQDAHGR